ncbi:DNA recombination protein RmuC [bacterium]|nr:DNA recombination protein RmuC [bacterium]
MNLIFLSSLGLFLFGFVALALWLQRSQQNQSQMGFTLLSESFESLQRNLLVAQKEFERSQDLKNSTLRTELSESLQQSRIELQKGLVQASQSLDVKVGSLEKKLETRLGDLTQSVGNKLELNLKEGFLHFDKIQEHLKKAELQLIGLNQVGQSINDLNNLLKLPHLRGGFGEAMLESLLTDLLPQDCFELQYRVVPHSTERVDAVIKYPNAVLPIDSKFPKEQVLSLFETQDPSGLESARQTLYEVMRTLSRQIRDKYIHPEHGTTDMALLFVPSETLYFEMLRSVKLCEELSKNKVFAVSPNTLSVTLHAVSVARNYYEMAKGVEKTILEVKKSQQHFENFESRFEEIGNSLQKAQASFGVAGTHLSRFRSAVSRLTGMESNETIKANPDGGSLLPTNH